MLRRDAPAKINLSLEVIGRRSDGYHELRSIMQAVSVVDTLAFSLDETDRLSVSDPALSVTGNLVARARDALRRAVPWAPPVSIDLEKRIPVAAGLGGGSSDAASALIALNQLWQPGIPADQLCDLAAGVGSDVPFFLTGGTALVSGRGETVRSIVPAQHDWYLLVKPPFEVSTARVFQDLRPDEWSSGDATETLAAQIECGGSPRFGPNDLISPLFRLYPAEREYYDLVASLSPDDLTVSGSGPTIVGLYRSREAAVAAARRVPLEYWSCVTVPYDRRED